MAASMGSSSRRRVHAFFCYAQEDRWAVEALANVCRAVFVEPLADYRVLEPGTDLEQGLWKAIDQADVFFVIWTRRAAASVWVAKEIDRFLRRCEQSPELRLVPILLDGTPLREDLQRFLGIDMRPFIDAEPAAGWVAYYFTAEGEEHLRAVISRAVWEDDQPPFELRAPRLLRRLLVVLVLAVAVFTLMRACS